MTENESGKGGLFTTEEMFVFLQLIMGETGVGSVLLKLEKYYFDGVASAVDAALENYFEDMGFQEKIDNFDGRLTELEKNTLETKNLLLELIERIDEDPKNGNKVILRKKKVVQREKAPVVSRKEVGIDKKLTGLSEFVLKTILANPQGLSVQKIQELCEHAGFTKRYVVNKKLDKKAYSRAISNALNPLKRKGQIRYVKKERLYFPLKKK